MAKNQKAKNVLIDKLGWETTSQTKHDVLFGLKSAVEDGKLVIEDKRILKEMRSFTYSDADNIGSAKQDLSTNHWDLLMACAIAWEMRKYAMESVDSTSKTFVQQPYESSSPTSG